MHIKKYLQNIELCKKSNSKRALIFFANHLLHHAFGECFELVKEFRLVFVFMVNHVKVSFTLKVTQRYLHQFVVFNVGLYGNFGDTG